MTSDQKTPTREYEKYDAVAFISRKVCHPVPGLGVMAGRRSYDDVVETALWVRTKDPKLVLSYFKANCEASARDMFLHGRESYEKWVSTLNKCLLRNGASPMTLTYDDLVGEYVQKL
jgi:hypothetical protein